MATLFSFPEKSFFIGVALALLASSFIGFGPFGETALLRSLAGGATRSQAVAKETPTETQLEAIIHYATSPVVPMLSEEEIRYIFEVIKSRGPCNFLVFGVGLDSLMWISLNARGTTLFIENDPKWVQIVLQDVPNLRVHTIAYRTQVSQADHLLSSYRSEPQCSPSNGVLRGNTRCALALDNLPDDVYETDWDLILIDAPRGITPQLPGRMAPIFSAAVMARNRKGSGTTHVFVHNVDRKEEKTYSEEFLCNKNLVKVEGRLGHFEIPPAANLTDGDNNGASFC